jgi:hypothetical protein
MSAFKIVEIEVAVMDNLALDLLSERRTCRTDEH